VSYIRGIINAGIIHKVVLGHTVRFILEYDRYRPKIYIYIFFFLFF
jgi:hypothetical protein